MKYLLYIFLALIVGLASWYFWEGRKFEGYISQQPRAGLKVPINSRAPVQAQKNITIDAPVGRVYSVLIDIERWPQWQTDLSSAVVNGEPAEGTTFDWSAGGLDFHSRIHTLEENQRLGWTGKTTGAYAVHNWTFEEQDGQTIVRVEESLQGFFPGLMSGYFQKNLEQGMERQLQELKARAEEDL